MVLDHGAYIVQDLYSRGFLKLVPLAKDSHTPNVCSGGVIAIADDPRYWNPSKLADKYHRFHNIATTFGPMVLPDGSIGYNHCLDIDAKSIMEAMHPYLEDLKKLTFIVQTKKGLHIHWIEHTQHERIGAPGVGRNVKRSTTGFEFEIKTDHKGGLSHLPGSLHRDDVKEKNPNPFRYHRLEDCADKVAVIDDFKSSGLGLYDFLLQDHVLGQYIREPGSKANASKSVAKEQEKKEDQPEQNQQQTPSTTTRNFPSWPQSSRTTSDYDPDYYEDENEIGEEEVKELERTPPGAIRTNNDIPFICADRLYGLVERWYVKDYRNKVMLAITGEIRRDPSDISLNQACWIVSKFCDIAGDDEPRARDATLRATYDKDPSECAGLSYLKEVIKELSPELTEDQLNNEIKKIKDGFRAALCDFQAVTILYEYPSIEINDSLDRHIVVFDETIEEVDFPQNYNSIFSEHIRQAERKSLLLHAAPMVPIEEIWDPIYQHTKYRMGFRSIGKNGQVVKTAMPKAMTIDELEEWVRLNARFYHKPGRLGEALRAAIDAFNMEGRIMHKIGTDIEGLVSLPTIDEHGTIGKNKLQLCNRERPSKPTQEQARACIELIIKVKTEFYSNRPIDTIRFSHFLKIGVSSVVDFARRQIGAVENYDVIPRQDLSGWTHTGKTIGYAAIPLRLYDQPLTKLSGVDLQKHSYVVSSGSIDTVARFIEQTLWTTFPVIFDEADRYSNWEDDKEAYKIVNTLKSSVMLTNPRDTLTSDSEMNLKPSAAFVILTHNSGLISEDGFSRRSDGHEFTYADMKKPEEKEKFNAFWASEENRRTFAYLGKNHCINYYLDHPDVLYKTHKDIARILLQDFWELAGYSLEEFKSEWDSWLGEYVVSANSKEALIQARKEKVISMLRQMINDAWVRNRQPVALWLARKQGVAINNDLDRETGRYQEQIEKIISEASFEDKLEALVKTSNLTYLVWHDTAGVTIDSSIVSELKRNNITGVTLKGLGDLLGFKCDPIRFSTGVKKVVHASVKEFADKLAPQSLPEGL